MSYFAIATFRFDAMVDFYVDRLGLALIDRFERPGARGAFVALGPGTRLEIIDASVQKRPMRIELQADDRLHLVIETDDIEAEARERNLPSPEPTSWGASVIRLKDPDGIGVWLLQWTDPSRRHDPPPRPAGT